MWWGAVGSWRKAGPVHRFDHAKLTPACVRGLVSAARLGGNPPLGRPTPPRLIVASSAGTSRTSLVLLETAKSAATFLPALSSDARIGLSVSRMRARTAITGSSAAAVGGRRCSLTSASATGRSDVFPPTDTRVRLPYRDRRVEAKCLTRYHARGQPLPGQTCSPCNASAHRRELARSIALWHATRASRVPTEWVAMSHSGPRPLILHA